MRVKMTLQVIGDPAHLPINYQYPLSSAIYKILSASSKEYSNYLHNKGYIGKDGKPRKLFNFSNLFITPRALLQQNSLIIQPESTACLYVSSPMTDDFLRNLFVGLFKEKNIIVENLVNRAILKIVEVDALPNPDFKQTENFRALSPIVVKTTTEGKKEFKTYYYRPLDAELSNAVRQSLIHKFVAVYGHQPKNGQLEFKIDQNYINRRGGQNRVSKLITIHEGHPDATKIKAFICPFTLSGSKELMQIAWDCGLGDKTSMGFGCVSPVDYVL